MLTAPISCTYGFDVSEYAKHFLYAPLSGTTCAVTGSTLSDPVSLAIPEQAPDGRMVVAVGDRAFSNYTTLRAVTLPDSVISIGTRAFAFCSGLLDIRLGADSRLTRIGDRAFIGCERLSVLRFGHLVHLESLGRNAFAYCTRLRSVILPDGLTELAPSLFESCTALEHIRLPAALRTIRVGAFSTCRALRSLSLPAAVAVIEDCAFAFCDGLINLRLPEQTCLIAATAFMECPLLSDVLKVG